VSAGKHETERRGSVSLGDSKVHAILSSRNKEIPVVPLAMAELAQDLLGDLDMGLCSAVGLRMIGRDGAMVETKAILELIHDGVDKLSAVVRLEDLGKSKVGEGFIKTGADGEGSLVRNGSEESEASRNVGDDQEEVSSMDRGREGTGKVDGQVVKGKAGMDGIQRVESVA